MANDVWATGGDTSGSVKNGQTIMNPGSAQGDRIVFNREQQYSPQTILEQSGDYADRFDDPTYYG